MKSGFKLKRKMFLNAFKKEVINVPDPRYNRTSHMSTEDL